MEHNDTQLQWTEEQWNLVQQTVRDEARKVRIAASFLPLYGPLPREAASVPLENLEEPADGSIRVDDGLSRRLTTISCTAELQGHQVAQPDLSSALILFRRAANIIARVEDRLIFGGQPGRDRPPPLLPGVPPAVKVTGGDQFRGLIAQADFENNRVVFPPKTPNADLVRSVSDAIGILENNGHLAPFALVLGNDIFVAAQTPVPDLVLPADRIKPFLDGPLLRSSTIFHNEGVLVSLASNPIDLVVASDIAVQFLQTTPQARYVFRIAERFTLRVKQRNAIVAILPN
jgi:uncharacterized linocin/CFP29 family protein